MATIDIKVKSKDGTIYRANTWQTSDAPELGYCRWAVYRWEADLNWWYKIACDTHYYTYERAIINALVSLPDDVFCECGGQYFVDPGKWGDPHLCCEVCGSELPDWDEYKGEPE